jgi:hypothetical protein
MQYRTFCLISAWGHGGEGEPSNETVEKPKCGGQKRSSRSGYPRG